ncbi:Insulin protein enhancer protein isl-1 [Homalodisca vitripennis]|nr:Insulin protein enhancer protein isl-1 [Homalodisca vitripennis]
MTPIYTHLIPYRPCSNDLLTPPPLITDTQCVRRCNRFHGVQDGRKMGYGSMQGIPMVASSPVRHESPLGMNPIEVTSYQPPWKALSDFALHTDLERMDAGAPPFQHLVSQPQTRYNGCGDDVVFNLATKVDFRALIDVECISAVTGTRA